MLNFLICDDNVPSLKRLSKILESIFINNNIDAQIGLLATTPSEALDYIKENKVDVVAQALVAPFRNALIDAGKTQRRDSVARLLKKLTAHGFCQHLTLALSSSGQRVIFAKARAASVDENFSFVKHNGLCRIASG